MSGEYVSLSASVRLGSVRDFVCAFLLITENGIEDVWDAEYTIEKVGREVCPHLWTEVSEVARGENGSIGDFYPIVFQVWMTSHWDRAVPPLRGEYMSCYSTESVATFDVDSLEVTLANFGRERPRTAVDSLAELLARGSVRYLSQNSYKK